MRTTRTVFYFAAALSGLALGAGAFSVGWPLAAALPVGLALLWMWAFKSGWRWLHGWMLFLYWGLALGSAWLGAGVLWTAMGLTGALAAWELAGFERRMSGYGEDSDLVQIVRRHSLRVGAVAVISLVLVGAALSVPLGFRFGWAAMAALLVFVGISQAVRYLRKGE